MSASRRRLSNGSALSDLTNIKLRDNLDDEEENQSIASKNTSVSVRRRSSFGLACKSPPFNPVEQLRITEMYKTVIQMSAENVSLSFIRCEHITSDGIFTEIK